MDAKSVATVPARVDRTGPIAWDVARSTAVRLVGRGPQVPMEDAVSAVSGLRDLSAEAEGHVRELTGLGYDLPLRAGLVLDRPGWASAAVEGMAALVDQAMPTRQNAGLIAALASKAAGVQAGAVLAYLGGRVLGQYDPFGGDDGQGRLLLVAPNIVGVQRALRVPPADFQMWVCLHEATHRLQFTAVPWLRDHFATEVGTLLGSMDDTVVGALDQLPELVRALRNRRAPDGGEPPALVELLQSPAQRAHLDRLLALGTLLEGHADHVMDAVGPRVVPSVRRIRARFTVRRRGGGLLDRALRVLLGVDAKVRQYAEGAAFTRHVVRRVGMDGFNAVWTSPETLPTRAEIAEPAAWLRRVHG
ncbi:zinc-dependent metalloprotease [Actinoalloteichus spitiensis]|uniref:zinc-dependent metalloprotease n=1 Tax=Actinoalloteichus spitiensis TaxID=252394 RepID=UPI0012F65B3B|nr:zinc-dependent metalloprotease [Actinoalloteichus spitiensis]